MRISHLTHHSLVDGPGVRSVVFVQGCSIGCAGCQNKHLWPAAGGNEFGPEALGRALAQHNPRALTVSGGEPMQQAGEVAVMLESYRAACAPSVPHVIVYTGYRWEQLPFVVEAGALERLMAVVDVVVDGPFRPQHDNDLIQWRGSGNQRPIDVRRTWCGGPVVALEWDTLALTVTDDGVLAPVGVRAILPDWDYATARRCGQTI